MLNNIGPTELIVILIVLVILFGGNKLTELAKGAGEATREFKKATKDIEDTKAEVNKPITPEKETTIINDRSTLREETVSKHLKGGGKK